MRLVWFDDLPEGGAKRVVYEQIKELSQRHEITYITNVLPTVFDVSPFVQHKVVMDFDVTLKKGVWRPFSELCFWWKLWRRYSQVARGINKGGYDAAIIHPSRYTQAPWLLNSITIPCMYFAQEWLRIVYEPDLHPLPSSFLKSIFERWRRAWIARIDLAATQAAHVVVTTSRYMQRVMRLTYDRSIELLPLGVDAAVFKKKNTSTRKYFLFVGEAEEINGYPLIAAINSDATKRFPIQLVTFKKGSFVYSDATMAKLYSGAIATLCLAVDEPFGLAALESMACQTPVIAVKRGGYLDTVVDEVTGLVIEPNTNALVDAMKRLYDDARLRERLGKAGRKRATESYSWKRHNLQLEGLIMSMVKKHD